MLSRSKQNSSAVPTVVRSEVCFFIFFICKIKIITSNRFRSSDRHRSVWSVFRFYSYLVVCGQNTLKTLEFFDRNRRPILESTKDLGRAGLKLFQHYVNRQTSFTVQNVQNVSLGQTAGRGHDCRWRLSSGFLAKEFVDFFKVYNQVRKIRRRPHRLVWKQTKNSYYKRTDTVGEGGGSSVYI